MVTFYLRDKSYEKTSIGCSVNYPGEKRIWFAVQNIKIMVNPKRSINKLKQLHCLAHLPLGELIKQLI